MIKVGLLWHSLSSDNLGVVALTVSNMDLCRSAARAQGLGVEFLIIGTSGSTTASNYEAAPGVSVATYSRRAIINPWSQLSRQLKTCDVIIDIGEGDSFSDIYGMKRFLDLIVTKFAVTVRKIPLLLAPQTIGPFVSPFARLAARLALKQCTTIVTRDSQSTFYARELVGTKPVAEAIDVAVSLPFVASENTDGERVRVALNVSGLLFSGGYTKNNQFGLAINYREFTYELVKKLLAHPSVELWLVPHVLCESLPEDDDVRAINQLAAHFPAVKIAETEKDPSAVKSFIARMDFAVGARMHFCIAALTAGVPVVPVSYSRKFNGLFQSIDYPILADARVQNESEILNLITTALAGRKAVALQCQQSIEKASQRLSVYRNELSDLFADIKREGATS